MIRVVAAAFLALLPQATLAQERLPAPVLKSAELIQPTHRYDHGILGDAVEWGAMRLVYDLCVTCGSIKEKSVLHVLPASRVFEDATARLSDLDGDGLIEVVVVETVLEIVHHRCVIIENVHEIHVIDMQMIHDVIVVVMIRDVEMLHHHVKATIIITNVQDIKNN